MAVYPSAQDLLDHPPDESEPGCILLDVRIPGLSGPELQERLRELGSTLPIIFLTGYPDVRTTVRTIKAGAEDFLTKPESSDRLPRNRPHSLRIPSGIPIRTRRYMKPRRNASGHGSPPARSGSRRCAS